MAGFLLLFQVLQDEIRPRYLEALEESLNDIVHIAAAAAEEGASERPNIENVRHLMERAKSRRFNARIYNLTKEKINISLYVTDARGIVLYDSDGLREGQDFSSWNDVKKTLRGEYGARSTRVNRDDPRTGSLYIAAPVRSQGLIIGSVTVVKANDTIQPFVRIAQKKLSQAAGLTALLVLLAGAGVFFWITIPIRRLTEYVRSYSEQHPLPPPDFGRNEIGDLARAFEQMRRELDGKAYVERYVRTLTHEIKSPIASIRAAAELLTENPPEADRKKFLENIQSESERMENLTRRLLELSTIEGRALTRKEPVNAGELLAEAVRRTGGLFEKRGLTVAVDAQPAALTADRAVIESALVNLLENAADFAETGTSIRASVQPQGSSVLFSVRNKGPAVPAYALERIFERFYSTARPSSGRKSTGLGLCFVSEAAELHQGTARVFNTEDGVAAELALPSGPGVKPVNDA